MEQLLNPPPQMDTPASDGLRDDIVKILHEKKLQVEDLKAPFLFDWGSIASYNGGTLRTVLTAAKNNVVSICTQTAAALEKVDISNRGNVNTFLLAVAIRNVAGKSSNSKAASLGLDGILSVYTIFEDNLNCANYLERKILSALNDFRPPAGQSAPAKIEIAAPAPAPVEELTAGEPEPAAAPEVKGLDLAIPNFPDPAHETLKKEILKVLDGQKLKLDPNYVGGNVLVPIVLDWSGFSSYTGSTLGNVLRAVKNGIANICGQVSSAYDKANRDRLPVASQYITLVVIQNIPGKSANDKKACLHVEGHLLINTIFEDSMNCTYYIEKKVILAIDDFRAPPGVNPPARPQSVPTYVAPPAAASPAPTTAASTTTTTTTTSKPAAASPSPSPAKPAASTPSPSSPSPAPVASPTPAPVAAKPAEPAKPKGRPEYEGLPFVEEPTIQHMMREIQAMARSQHIVVEAKGAPIGAPILIDWASILVYSGAKQSTVMRNVHINVLRLSRDIVHAIKLACTDPVVKPSVATYLRSVTIKNVQGAATSAKKVTYEDGHMVLETAFEDASNCALYFESKITQELGARAKGSAPAKPGAEEMLKEEIDAKITAHADKDYKKLIPPTTVVAMDYTSLGKSFADLAPNAAGSVTQIMQDLVAVIVSLKEKDNAEIRNELKKITISHVNSHATDDKKKVDYLDDGNLIVISTFDDKVGSAQGWRDKFTKGLAIILKKIHIRDHLMPQYTKHVSVEATQEAQVNPWIPIKSYPTENPLITVLFDWKVLHHFTHTQDFVIEHLDKIIKNLESQFVEGMLTNTFHDVCNYDVGKHAVQSFVKTIILRETLKAKDEKYHYKPEDGVLMFEATFHNPAETKTRDHDLIKHMKEQLRVAHPCAVQDAYHHVVKINADLARNIGKPGLPLIIDWNSFVPVPNFQSKFEGYMKIHKLVVSLVGGGLLSGSTSMSSLAQDPIVKDALAKKLDKIIIRVDPNDGVRASPGRPGDPLVKAEWENKTTLVFTQNAKAGFDDTREVGWGYVMELALDTRPPKVQRAIANNKANTQKLSTQLQTLLGFPVAVDVDYEGFIHSPEFALYLDEKPYHNAIEHAAYNVAATILGQDALGGLKTYKTLVPLMKDRLTNIIIKVSAQDKINLAQTLTISGKTLAINLNLGDIAKPAFETKLYTKWRIPLEALLNLRDTKVQEEIADRVKVVDQQKSINNTIGGNATLKVKWDTIINSPAFAANKDDYIDWLHAIGEKIGSRLAGNDGFGRLCEYDEVKKHIAGKLKGIEIEADNVPNVKTPWGFSFNQGTGILQMHINVGGINGNVGGYDFYTWGWIIEEAMGIRHLIIQGKIDRNKRVLDSVAAELSSAVHGKLKVVVDWESFIRSPIFSSVKDYRPIIDYVAHTTEEWLPLTGIVKDNHELMNALKDNVNTFILRIDPTSSVNESSHLENEYGVDYAEVKHQNSTTQDVIVGTVNYDAITSTRARGMEMELKVELLITPEYAKDRLREKKNRLHEANMEAGQRAMVREQQRTTSAMKDQAHEMHRMNNWLRR